MSSLRRQLLKKNSETLPEGWSQINKIDTERRYIKTDYIPNNYTKIEIKATNYVTYQNTFFGSWVDGYYNNFGFWVYSYNNSFYTFMNDGPNPINLQDLPKIQVNVPFIFVKDSINHYLNGIKSQYSSTPLTDSQLPRVQPLNLFRNMAKWETYIQNFGFFYLKIWEKNILVKNYIPIINNTTGETAVYETINKKMETWMPL